MSNHRSYIYASIAIMVLVAVVLGFNSSGITGAQTGINRGARSICTETDPDEDDFKFGVVTINERDDVKEYPDKCFDKTLVQHFCQGTTRLGTVGRPCKNECKEGVCIR